MNTAETYFGFANQAVKEISKYLIDNFGDIKDLIHKTDSHYGIKEDKIANKMYEDFFRVKTPEIALYTEEGQKNLKNDLVWVIDPIEGTSNYRAGNPFFATQVALLQNDKPILAIVNAPVLKQKFTAMKGKGSFLNGKRIRIGKINNLNKALIDIGRGTKKEYKSWSVNTLGSLNLKIRTNRTFGATGLCMCYCASGIFDIHINNGSQLYDYIPGVLLVRESGGHVINLQGNKWTIKDKGLIASNKKLLNDILKII